MAENDHEKGELSPRDEKLALALAGGSTPFEAAEAVGVSVKTVRRKQSIPEFKALVRKLRGEITSATVGGFVSLGGLAVAELRGLLADPDPKVRLGAVRAVIAGIVRIGPYGDLAERMTELEAEVADQKGPTA